MLNYFLVFRKQTVYSFQRILSAWAPTISLALCIAQKRGSFLGPASPISFTAEHQALLFYAGCKSGLEGGQCICQGLLLPSVYVEKLTKTSDGVIQYIPMTHWRLTMVDRDEYWRLLRKASHWQLIQNSAPCIIMWRQCDIRIVYFRETRKQGVIMWWPDPTMFCVYYIGWNIKTTLYDMGQKSKWSYVRNTYFHVIHLPLKIIHMILW